MAAWGGKPQIQTKYLLSRLHVQPARMFTPINVQLASKHATGGASFEPGQSWNTVEPAYTGVGYSGSLSLPAEQRS
jgi:hypothetical protein